MTEILSFFCDPAEVHDMKDLVISSIVRLIRKNDIYSDIQNAQAYDKPKREVATKNNKRIDLLLSSDEWVIAIENKVYHDQINPFKEYETHVESLTSSNIPKNIEIELKDEVEKQAVFVILSPDGNVENASLNIKWCGISFQQLVNEVKEQLQQHFFAAPFNKWCLVLKDFLLHLENLVNDSQQNSAQEEFALCRLSEISQAWQLLKNTLQSVRQQAHIKLEQHPELKGVLVSKKSSWFDLPTTILYSKDETIEVALFATDSPTDFVTEKDQLNAGKYIFIQIHIQTDDSQLELSSYNDIFAGKSYDKWYSGNTHYYRWPTNSLTVDGLTQELVETYEALTGLEHLRDKSF
jgi:hypothetical protein